ncbi:VanZ family protein [Kitasatospora sp. NPDC085895]|uniref:VanZ family protein n=1 Tax=Kitasatospora sp. NPDC085895 TaxID=3155057 RepID=UPI00344B0806
MALRRTVTGSGTTGSGGSPGGGPAAAVAVRLRAEGTAARRTGKRRPQEPQRPLPFLHRPGVVPALVRLLVLLVALAATVLFAVVLARATLVPQPGSRGLVHANLRPGSTLELYLDRPAVREAVKQVGGNLLLGAPFGILLPLLSRRVGGLLRVTLLTAVTMVLVECAQAVLVPGRAFDIDDVLLNTAGAVLLHLVAGRRIGRALHRAPHAADRPRAG